MCHRAASATAVFARPEGSLPNRQQTRRQATPEPSSVAERVLHQAVKVLPPDLVVVAVAGILTPDVLHAGVRERVVHGAATIDRGVLGARADEDHLVVLVRLRRVGGEQVRGTESAERADGGKQFRMAEADGGAG